MPSNYLLWFCYHSTVVPQILLVYTTQICKWIETNLVKILSFTIYVMAGHLGGEREGGGGGWDAKGRKEKEQLSPFSPIPLSFPPHPLPPPHTPLMHSTLLILVVHRMHAIWTQFTKGSSRLKKLRCPTGILEGHGFETLRETDFCFVLQPSQKVILGPILHPTFHE